MPSYRLTCREALFGGAAGGGKSDALLMAAVQYVDVPGYAAVLFRRTFADLALPGAAMSRAQEWAGAHRREVGRQQEDVEVPFRSRCRAARTSKHKRTSTGTNRRSSSTLGSTS